MRDWITLTEQWAKAVQVYDESVDVFVNPSRSEFAKLARSSNGCVRGTLVGTDLYVWNGFLSTHWPIRQDMKLTGQNLMWLVPEKQLPVYWDFKLRSDIYPACETDDVWGKRMNFPDFAAVEEWLRALPALKGLVDGFNMVRQNP